MKTSAKYCGLVVGP